MKSWMKSSIANSQPKTLLRYRWTKGETLRYRSRQITKTEPGTPVDLKFNQTVTQVTRFHVERVAADGRATLRRVIDSATVKTTSPLKKHIETGMKAMIGKPITIALSPTGAVQSVRGVKRLVDEILKDLPINAAVAKAIKQQKKVLTESFKLAGKEFPELPSRPLRRGAKWRSEIALPDAIQGGLRLSIDATLKGLDRRLTANVAKIATRLNATSSSAAESVSASGAKMHRIAGAGEILFDVGRGQWLRSSTRMRVQMTTASTDLGDKVTKTRVNLITILTAERISTRKKPTA